MRVCMRARARARVLIYVTYIVGVGGGGGGGKGGVVTVIEKKKVYIICVEIVGFRFAAEAKESRSLLEKTARKPATHNDNQ